MEVKSVAIKERIIIEKNMWKLGENMRKKIGTEEQKEVMKKQKIIRWEEKIENVRKKS